MTKSDKFVGAAVLLAAMVNLAAAYFDRRYPSSAAWSADILAGAVGLYALFRFFQTTLQYFRYGRYAVLIFFLNNRNDLLLIRHPFHKCYLPPGGRLKQWELPHEALAKRLREETGITAFDLHPHFHNRTLVISEIVEDVPRPYSVHMEHRRQRGLVRFHYAFVYVCKFKGRDEELPQVETYEPRFFSLQQIYNMPRGVIPYGDIIRRYEDILVSLRAA
jgi:8-oxo-dGTP pyrophosphatase MutT (NUDIX family)